MDTIHVDNNPVSFDIRGNGEAAILFNHSGASSNGWSELFVETLATKLTVVTVDYRGTGYSGIGTDPFTLLDLAADGHVVLDHSGIDKAMVIGTSMGGAVAQEFTLAYPDQVTAQILMGTFAGQKHFVAPDQKVLDLVGEIFPRWDEVSAVERWQQLLPTIYGPSFLQQHQEFALELELRGGRFSTGETIARHSTAVSEFEAFDRLPSLSVPTLIIHGTEDPIIPVKNGEILAGQIHDSEFMELAGTGHLPAAERPLAVADHILHFASRNGLRIHAGSQ